MLVQIHDRFKFDQVCSYTLMQSTYEYPDEQNTSLATSQAEMVFSENPDFCSTSQDLNILRNEGDERYAILR